MKRFFQWLFSGSIKPEEYEHYAKLMLRLI